jgi:hypothetical protein
MSETIDQCSVIINGKEFIRKDQIEKAKELDGMPYKIVRTQSAGVIAGYIESVDGDTVKIRQARRLWYWDGAASISQMAMEGVKKPENCKFPCSVDEDIVRPWIELIPCTEQARKSIQGVKVWEMK